MKYFESKTASGNIQINDSFMNLYLSRKIPVGVGTGSGSFQEGEFLAAIGNGTNSLNGCCSNKPTGYDYKLNSSNTQAYIYVFSNTPKSLGNCGLQVFNAAGQIIFDSNAKQAFVLSCGGVGTSSTGSNLAIACGGFTAMSNYNSTGYSEIYPQAQSDTFYYTKQETKPVIETYIEYEWQTGSDGMQHLVPVTKTRIVWKTFYTQVPQFVRWTDYTVTTWAIAVYHRELNNLLLENGVAKIFKYSVSDNTSKTGPNSVGFSGKPTVLNTGQVITNDQSSVAQDRATRYQKENTWYEYSSNDIYAYSCVILDASSL